MCRREIISVRSEIFRLAKQAKDLEIMHWYISLDDCFENDEFSKDQFKNLQWRMFVLKDKGEPIGLLMSMFTPMLQTMDLVNEKGEPK